MNEKGHVFLLEFCVGFNVLGRYPGCFATGMAFFLVNGIFVELILFLHKILSLKRTCFYAWRWMDSLFTSHGYGHPHSLIYFPLSCIDLGSFGSSMLVFYFGY